MLKTFTQEVLVCKAAPVCTGAGAQARFKRIYDGRGAHMYVHIAVINKTPPPSLEDFYA